MKVLFCSCFSLFFGNPFNSRYCNEVVIKSRNIVSYDDLELSCIREHPFYARYIFDRFFVRFSWIIQDKTHTSRTMTNCSNIFFSADIMKQLLGICLIFCHINKPLSLNLSMQVVSSFTILFFGENCKRFIKKYERK